MISFARSVLIRSILVAPLACDRPADQHPDIPPAPVFRQVLARDLETYFARAESTPIHVTYELLREQPTITGIAYPKYYVWVQIRSGERLLRVGAVRLAAVNDTFEVTNFLPAAAINSDTSIVGSVFPAPLAADIIRRARAAPPVPKRGA
jgi:hypothetical protein